MQAKEQQYLPFADGEMREKLQTSFLAMKA